MQPEIIEHRARLRRIARQAMVEHDLEPDFPPAALAELARLASPPPRPDLLRDLRDRLWCSIDNDDSRDLDQLTVSETLAAGVVKVYVAVADVDALVRKDSPIDAHAHQNTTSVYTAAEIFPMLPERLSTDLTSLNAGEDRPAIIVEMAVKEDGAVGDSAVYPAVVRNKAKLAYNAVAAWLDGSGPMPDPMAVVPGMDQQIRMQDQVAHHLDEFRRQQGALDLETIETRPVFDGDTLRDLAPDERNRAKEIIENFMVAANGVTARFLDARGFPSLRRVVRTPKRWDRIVELARQLGESLPPEPDARALQQFLVKRRAADPIRFPDLSLSVIKLLGAGEYILERAGEGGPGHFGLAVADYTHSTAPNRRYPDLITQRLLKAAFENGPRPYGDEELSSLATYCTRKEDDANKVERLVGKAAAALLLEGRVGERFDGLVTGASSKGTWVRIFHPPIEGRVVRGFEGLDVGDRVRVRLVETDPERGFIDFVTSR
jgi:VacB/RNase II family 3'-5' exoribonuclease